MSGFMRDSDAFAWYMENDPTLRSTVVAVVWLERAPDWDVLVAKLERATHVIPRFRQRVVEPPWRLATPRWTVDETFDVARHLHRVDATDTRVRRGSNAADIVLTIARAAATEDFDRSRPLWDFTLIEHIGGEQAALVMKLHHSLTDGVGGIQLALLLFDLEAYPTPPPPSPPEVPSRQHAESDDLILLSLARGGERIVDLVTRAGRSAIPRTLRVARHPMSSLNEMVETMRSIGRTVAPVSATMSPTMKGRGVSRYVDVLEVQLGDLKRAAAVAGGSVNDGFLAGVTGGMRRYHERHAVPVDQLRVTLPISIRTPEDPIGGNRITLIRFAVPVADPDPASRIHELGRLCRAARHERSLQLTDSIAATLNLLPPAVVGGMLKHVDFVASDVAGFTFPVYLAGARVERNVAFGPTTGTAANFTLLSHDGTCCVGINIDTAAVPDPEVLVECMREGFEEILALGGRHDRVSLPMHDGSSMATASDRQAGPPRREARSDGTRAAKQTAKAEGVARMERMSPLDATFLYVEDGVTHMHIASCAVFEGPAPTYDRVVAAIAGKLDLIPRYRQVVRFVPLQLGRPVWVDDPHFRLEYHVRHTALPPPGGDAELQALMGRIMSQELDRHRPLWEVWMIEGMEDGRWGLITKIHHCMADGIAGTDLLAVLLDFEPDPPPPVAEVWRPAASPSDRRLVADAVVDLARIPFAQLQALGDLTRSPRRSLTQLREIAAGMRSYAGSFEPTRTSSLVGAIGPHRRWTWASVDLDDAKLIRHAFGGTVNDVIVTVVTSGLRRLLLARGEPLDELTVRSLIPVSIRSDEAHNMYDNRVTAMFADLPVAIDDPIERLAAVREQVALLKASHQADAGMGLITLSQFAPSAAIAFAERSVMRVLRHVPQHSIATVATNVPGPQHPLYLAGREMLEYLPFVPIAPGVRVGIAIVSYNGRLAFGITGDFDTAPDIDVVANGIEDAIAELVGCADLAGDRRSSRRRRQTQPA